MESKLASSLTAAALPLLDTAQFLFPPSHPPLVLWDPSLSLCQNLSSAESLLLVCMPEHAASLFSPLEGLHFKAYIPLGKYSLLKKE